MGEGHLGQKGDREKASNRERGCDGESGRTRAKGSERAAVPKGKNGVNGACDTGKNK